MDLKKLRSTYELLIIQRNILAWRMNLIKYQNSEELKELLKEWYRMDAVMNNIMIEIDKYNKK